MDLCENYVTWKLGTKVQRGWSGFTASLTSQTPTVFPLHHPWQVSPGRMRSWISKLLNSPGNAPPTPELLFPSHWPLPSRREPGMRHNERTDVATVVQLLSRVRLCGPTDRSMPGFPVHRPLPELAQTHVQRVSKAIQPSHPRSSPFPLAFNPSQHQGLFRFGSLIRWPKYWSFSFSISPSNEYSRLISFRMDWFDLLAVQGTVKSLLQHHSSESIYI